MIPGVLIVEEREMGESWKVTGKEQRERLGKNVHHRSHNKEGTFQKEGGTHQARGC